MILVVWYSFSIVHGLVRGLPVNHAVIDLAIGFRHKRTILPFENQNGGTLVGRMHTQGLGAVHRRGHMLVRRFFLYGQRKRWSRDVVDYEGEGGATTRKLNLIADVPYIQWI